MPMSLPQRPSCFSQKRLFLFPPSEPHFYTLSTLNSPVFCITTKNMYFLTPILILATLTALTHALPPQKGPFGQSTADFYLPNLRLPWGPKYWSCIPVRFSLDTVLFVQQLPPLSSSPNSPLIKLCFFLWGQQDRLPCSEDKNCCSSNCACFEIVSGDGMEEGKICMR